MLLLSVVISTHNPNPDRLTRTLAGLHGQTLPTTDWECLLVDNASTPPLTPEGLGVKIPAQLHVIREATLGLTAARRAGLAAATGGVVVLVDDDNVLAPDYLAQVLNILAAHPRLGAFGGKSLPRFDVPPPPWLDEFYGLLACRDLGESEILASQLWNASAQRNEYPPCAPIGAGMALRREAALAWVEASARNAPSDRRGAELSSGGDNDIVLTVIQSGWQVGYFPELSLTHLIPASRLQPDYLARLNRGIAKSWVQVLEKYHANPWPPIPRWTVPLRQFKAWFTHRAWSGPAARIRWAGACGHFAGRALLPRT